jgi:hypothetical protein
MASYDFRFNITREADSYLQEPVWSVDGSLVIPADEEKPDSKDETVGTLVATYLTGVDSKLDLLRRADMVSHSLVQLAEATPADDGPLNGLSYGTENVHQWLGIEAMIIVPSWRGQRLGLLFMEHLLALFAQTETLVVGKAFPVVDEPSKHTPESLGAYWKSLGFRHDPATHIIHHHTNFRRRTDEP